MTTSIEWADETWNEFPEVRMKITVTNDHYKATVQIKVESKNALTRDEVQRVRIELGDAVIRAIQKLPFGNNSVAAGNIKIGR